MSTRGALPPTPPMQSDGGFDGRQSPSSASQSSYSATSAQPYYYAPSAISAINNVDVETQRQHVSALPRRVSMPTSMAYQQSPYNTSQYNISPVQPSMSSYYPNPMQPTPPHSQVSSLYYQRPLPQVCSLYFCSYCTESNNRIAVPSIVDASISHVNTFLGSKPMATPPLHLTIFSCIISSITRSLHLPDMQQGIFSTFKSKNSLSFTHWREAI